MEYETTRVSLDLRFWSDMLTTQALLENAIRDQDSLVIKSISYDETKNQYIADCYWIKETIH